MVFSVIIIRAFLKHRRVIKRCRSLAKSNFYLRFRKSDARNIGLTRDYLLYVTIKCGGWRFNREFGTYFVEKDTISAGEQRSSGEQFSHNTANGPYINYERYHKKYCVQHLENSKRK